jgi:predicted acylesterase/phospholipase RssA
LILSALFFYTSKMNSAAATSRLIPSFGFSGAGFLTCYHLGVAQLLLKHGLLVKPGQFASARSPTLTGVSGGALVAAVVSVGVHPEDAMQASLEVARRTRHAGGVLDALHPG